MTEDAITYASRPIWHLVSGYAPEAVRMGRRILFLQAYFDDSHAPGDSLVMAGYLASAEQWINFSDQWQEILDMRCPYPIHAYHAAERSNLGDLESERDMFLFRCIERNIEIELAICIDEQAVSYFRERYAGSYSTANLYHCAFSILMQSIAQCLGRLGIVEPIDIIFDDRSDKKALIESWDNFLGHGVHPDFRRYFRQPPSFRDDLEVKPLQAADMHAWHTLSQRRKQGTILDPNSVFPWKRANLTNQSLRIEPSRSEMRKFYRDATQTAMRLTADRM